MKVVKLDLDKIYNEMALLDENIFFDTIVDLYSIQEFVHVFSKILYTFHNLSEDDYITMLGLVNNCLLNRSHGYRDILKEMCRKADEYYSKTIYINISDDELKEAFRREVSPSMTSLGQIGGITPNSFLLYYYANGVFKSPRIDLLKEEYKVYKELSEKAQQRYQKLMNKDLNDYIDKVASGDAELKTLLNAYLINDFIAPPNFYDEVKRIFKVETLPDRKMIVSEGLVAFLYYKILFIHDLTNQVKSYVSALEYINRETSRRVASLESKFVNYTELSERLRKTESTCRKLRRENAKLEEKIKTFHQKDKRKADEEYLRLMKENSYLHTRIEKLEELIATYEEEARINREIKENITVDMIPITSTTEVDLTFKDVVVVGGKWNSRSRGEVEEWVNTKGGNIEFIDAEKTLRRIDRIQNADIIIFDTSRNAHAYFNKLKNNRSKLRLINDSSLEAVKNSLMISKF